MSLRLVADADFNRRIVRGLVRREPSIDFQTAAEAGLLGKRDPIVLKMAADLGRVLISHDRKTMPSHFTKFVKESQSPGLIIVPQDLDIGLAIEDLLLYWAATSPAELTNQIEYLPL